MHLILAVSIQTQVDLCKTEASLLYIHSFKLVRDTQRDPVSEKKVIRAVKQHKQQYVE